jgi:hypothetical protein
MSELTTKERLDQTESTLANVLGELDKIRTFDELDAVVGLVFEELKNLENKTIALENILDMINSNISKTNG